MVQYGSGHCFVQRCIYEYTHWIEREEAFVILIFFFLEINMCFHQMFWQQLPLPDSHEGKRISCWQDMIRLVDKVMTRAPEFDKTSLVGFPINVIFNRPMAIPAGFAAFLNDKVSNEKKRSKTQISQSFFLL